MDIISLILKYRMNKYLNLNTSNKLSSLDKYSYLSTLVVVKTPYTFIQKRSMGGRSLPIARAAYSCLNTFSNEHVVNNTTKMNHRPLTGSLVRLGLDHRSGTPQHKTAILHSMTNHRFSADDFLEPFIVDYSVGNFTWPPGALTDVRITKELPVYYALYQRYGSTIESTIATLDSQPGNFPHQIQSNQDFWLKLKTAVTFGNVKFRDTYHDEKSGIDMLKRSTRGSIGLLTYDSAGNNIQVTNKPISPLDLIQYNRDRQQGIKNGLKGDGLEDQFTEELNGHKNLVGNFNNIDKSIPQNIFDVHDRVQEYLWDNFQRHPKYNRSVSFVFTTTVDYSQAKDKQQAFEAHFGSLLQDKIYNLDSIADRKIVFNAMLTAYTKEVDPQILKKLKHYQQTAGIGLSSHFIQTIERLINHGIT